MPYTVQEKKKAITRLRRIGGQAQALERAIETGIECADVLQQLAALRGAVNGLVYEVLESHLRETFGHSGKNGKKVLASADADVDATIALFRSYVK